MCALWHFRLAGSCSLSVGGWAPSGAANPGRPVLADGWADSFLVFDVGAGSEPSPPCARSKISVWRDGALYPLSLAAWLPSAAPDHARAGGHGAGDSFLVLSGGGRRGRARRVASATGGARCRRSSQKEIGRRRGPKLGPDSARRSAPPRATPRSTINSDRNHGGRGDLHGRGAVGRDSHRRSKRPARTYAPSSSALGQGITRLDRFPE